MKVGLVQINNSFSGQSYFPYSVGLLQAYAQKHLKHPQDYQFLLPIYKRVKVEEGVQQLLQADVILFSLYVWNVRLSLEIARRIKEQNPEIVIVCGGPQVPDHGDEFLRANPFVDVACHGPGEKIICQILENCKDKNWHSIPSTSFLNEDGEFVQNPKIERKRDDLQNFPSPYLTDVFKPLMAANPHEKWLALWETNRGCPFACTFCDWGSATQSKVFQFDIEQLSQEVDWFAAHKIEFIFCCDANFGILRRDVDIVRYVAETKEKFGYPQALSVQNTKNARERAYIVQKMLADAGLNKGVTLSMQSMDNTTLQYIKRDNISLDAYRELQYKFTADRVETYNDLILGLPGETYDSFFDGVSAIIENGQHNRIQFNNLSILPNAEMGNPEYQKEHGMVFVESDIINIHGSLVSEEINERQQIVIAVDSMPKEDWVRTRAICWLTALLHFDKLLQIPFILLHKMSGLPYRELLEIFTQTDAEHFPIFSEIYSFFVETAKAIQNGGPEYCQSEKWLNIWWPADELILIELCAENQLNAFYQEVEILIQDLLKTHLITLPSSLLEEALLLNKQLIKLPFQTEDQTIEARYNIWEFYQNALVGIELSIEEGAYQYTIDRTSQTWPSWENWCQEVVWYGNKKGAYLYKIVPSDATKMVQPQPPESQIAGHY